MKKNKIFFFFKILKSRIVTVRKEVSMVALIAIASILVIELILKKYPADSEGIYDLGQIYLKVCYSIFAAYLFYFINIHIPKEIRKVKTYRLINNHVFLIEGMYEALLITIFKPVDDTINKEKIKEMNRFDFQNLCKRINPQSAVSSQNIFANGQFNTHYELIHYAMNKIKINLNELFVLYELIDTELLHRLIIINDIIHKQSIFDFQKFSNVDLAPLSQDFSELYSECQKMIDAFFKKHQKRYDFEYRYLTTER